MNKKELIDAVAAQAGISRDVSGKALNAALELITEKMAAGEKVQLVGFGAFEVKERAARKGRNPKTREEIEIPASRAPQFKPGKALKEAIEK